jgi:hypothetical protein
MRADDLRGGWGGLGAYTKSVVWWCVVCGGWCVRLLMKAVSVQFF